MTHSRMKQGILAGSLLITISAPIMAKQPLPLIPENPAVSAKAIVKVNTRPKGIVVKKPSHHPVKRAPAFRSYHRNQLPRDAAFVIIAGISYAVIDNAYYRRNHDTYVYVEQPPVQSVEEATAPETTVTSNASQGQIVDMLPDDVTTVTVNGVTFYVDGGDWYAPIAGTNQFVIVEPQF